MNLHYNCGMVTTRGGGKKTSQILDAENLNKVATAQSTLASAMAVWVKCFFKQISLNLSDRGQ